MVATEVIDGSGSGKHDENIWYGFLGQWCMGKPKIFVTKGHLWLFAVG